MNYFGFIVMVVKLFGVSEFVFIGDINQFLFLDRENLFQLWYICLDLVVGIIQELFCIYCNFMDVVYILSDIYSGIYVFKLLLLQVYFLSVRGYMGV